MGERVIVARNLTSAQADALITTIKQPPTTAKNVQKVPVAGGKFNVEATFPAAPQDNG